MNNKDHSVDRRLTELAEWLKANASNTCNIADLENTEQEFHHTNQRGFLYDLCDSLSGPFINFNGYENNGQTKPQRERTTFHDNHLKVLESCFKDVKHPDAKLRQKLAKDLGLPNKTIQIWFQNRRAREKKISKLKTSTNSDGNDSDCTRASKSSKPNNIDKMLHSSMNTGVKAAITETKTMESRWHQNKAYTTSTVQEVDNSRKYENPQRQPDDNSWDCRKTKCDEGFTIIHIPDIDKPKVEVFVEEQSQILSSGQTKNINKEENVENNTNDLSQDSLEEQQLQLSVDNLDLDLILETYKALESNNNPDELIKSWMNDGKGEDVVNALSLEENLKDFIDYSKRVKK